jgi:hypothetical protein
MVIWVSVFAAGAVKVPSLEIEPADADQVTTELLVPLTVAVNRCCTVGPTVAMRGETDISICAVG